MNLDSETRRIEIVQRLQQSATPLTGQALAEEFFVTRQVVVKDIAILKAQGLPVMATTKGYLLLEQQKNRYSQVVEVRHAAERIEEELQIIVDLGGHVVDTNIIHPYYGQMGEKLNVNSRRDINDFLQKTKLGGGRPLLGLTAGYHSHRIETDTQKQMEEIVTQLGAAGFLCAKLEEGEESNGEESNGEESNGKE